MTWIKKYPFHIGLLLCTLAYAVLLSYLSILHESGVYGDLVWNYIPAAQAFLEGDWTGGGHISGLGPIHPLLIALVGLIPGVHLFLAAKIVTIFVTLLSVWVSFFLLKRAFDEHIAFFGMLLYMAMGVALAESIRGLPDPTFTVLLLTALLFLTKPDGSWRHFLIGGMFAGLALGVKWNGFVLLPLAIGCELLFSPSRSKLRRRFANALVIFLGFAITGGAFLIYNTALMGSPFQTYYYSGLSLLNPAILPANVDLSQPFLSTLTEHWAYIVQKFPGQLFTQVTQLINDNLLLQNLPFDRLNDFWKFFVAIGILTTLLRPARLPFYLLVFDLIFFASLIIIYPVPRYFSPLFPLIAILPFVWLRWFAAPLSRLPAMSPFIRIGRQIIIYAASVILLPFLAWTYVQNITLAKNEVESLEAKTEFAPRVATYLQNIKQQHQSDWAGIGTYSGGVGRYWIPYYTGTLPLDIFYDPSRHTESGWRWNYEPLLSWMSYFLYSDERRQIHSDPYQPDLFLAEGIGSSLIEPIYQVSSSTQAILYRVLESNLIRSVEKLEVKPTDSPYDVQQLIDNKLSTGWFSAPASSPTETQELLFDLGQAQSVNRVLLVPWSNSYAYPEKFSLEASTDAQRWELITLTKVPQPPAPEAIPAFTFPMTQARYFKLLVSQMPSAGVLNAFRPVARWPDPNEQIKMGSGTQVKVDCPDRSFSFTNAESYVQIDDNSTLKPRTLTLSLWFKVNVLDGQLYTLIRQDQSEHYGYWLAWDNRGGRNQIWWEIGDGHTHFHTLLASMDLKAGEWAHVIATYDGRELKVFQNNKLVGSGVYADAIAYRSAPLFIGSTDTKGAYSFTGEIADVLVYDRVLTFNEIEELAALPRGACWSPLTASPISTPMYRFGLKEIRFSLATEKKRGLSKFTFSRSDISYDKNKNVLEVRLHNVGERESAAQVAFSIPARSLRSGQWTELGVVDSPVILPGQDGVVEFDLSKFNSSTLAKIAVTLDPYRAFTPRGETIWIELDK